MIRVLSPGMLTTVQDLGRPGYAHLGVSAAGAADPVALRVANRLVGNREEAPALEMTLRGGRFEFLADAWVCLAGGDFDSTIAMGVATYIRAGQVLEVGGCRSGARCYLAVRGGIAARYDLGSASTHLLSGLGTLLRRGDELAVGHQIQRDGVAQQRVTMERSGSVVRVTPGAETERFAGDAVFSFFAETWTVSEQSNRQGVRLRGGRIPSCPGGGVMASEGVALGAVQCPPGGEPVILFVDAQTTGGYPVIANVALVDIGVVGQLRPGAPVRFAPVGLDEARTLYMEQERCLEGLGA